MKTQLNVLDHGFVKLLNVSGPTRRPEAAYDADSIDPANTARISFGKLNEDRTREQDLKLVKYLLEHNHCYHPDMEVLTSEGWKQWKNCGPTETFMVPNIETNDFKKETLEVLSFDYDDDLCTFDNAKLSYGVTPNHKMYFKKKDQAGVKPHEFEAVSAGVMSKWGNFKNTGFWWFDNEGYESKAHALIGFYLGDGSSIKTSTSDKICFHLKKKRKQKYLIDLLNSLDIGFRVKTGHKGAFIYDFDRPDFFNAHDNYEHAKTKGASVDLSKLVTGEAYSLLDGLINSDGHIPKDRPNQTQFSSASLHLINLFDTLACWFGMVTKTNLTKPLKRITAYENRHVESRASFHSNKHHKGKVYCATTSTGWLYVRGSSETYGFVCGNSTPIEMIEVYLEMKLPIFVARQFVRHRTATINEVSGRYTQLPKEWYIPSVVGGKATSNKQGQIDSLDKKIQAEFKYDLNWQCNEAFKKYKYYLDSGVAPEHARLFLHVNNYTHWVWKQDLNNMLHFLKLRLDSHAQIEAQQYAQAVLLLLADAIPDLMWIVSDSDRI